MRTIFLKLLSIDFGILKTKNTPRSGIMPPRALGLLLYTFYCCIHGRILVWLTGKINMLSWFCSLASFREHIVTSWNNDMIYICKKIPASNDARTINSHMYIISIILAYTNTIHLHKVLLFPLPLSHKASLFLY